MPKITLSKEDAQSIVWGEHKTAKTVVDKITHNSRWSENHELVFELDGKLYRTYYGKGLTEYQDEGPFDYVKEVECVEVERYERTVVDYRPVGE